MASFDQFRLWFKGVVNIGDQIDTEMASRHIKTSIWFKGPNVWILAFSVIIASVGLNINSTAVIIGAMLISPLMGPIMGIGLALGTNDMKLLKESLRNFLVMVLVSLAASFVYFLLSPLNLVNPTELQARTRPTIFDVLIALFGGLAGILETSRKEKGTVISGVAIATALMPPLCTAGFGLAKADMRFFLGAIFLFAINSIFIIIATYVMTKYLRFKEVEFTEESKAKKVRLIMTAVILAVSVPSIWSAIKMVGENNFERNVQSFIHENKNSSKGYIYDYKILEGRPRRVEVYYAGNKMTEEELGSLVESARLHGIDTSHLVVKEQDFGVVDKTADNILKGIYERSEDELAKKDARIGELEDAVLRLKGESLDYPKLAKEVRFNCPEVKDLSIAKGATVDDSLKVRDCTVVLLYTDKALPAASQDKVRQWLRLRLEDSTVVVHNVAGARYAWLSGSFWFAVKYTTVNYGYEKIGYVEVCRRRLCHGGVGVLGGDGFPGPESCVHGLGLQFGPAGKGLEDGRRGEAFHLRVEGRESLLLLLEEVRRLFHFRHGGMDRGRVVFLKGGSLQR